jgi:hypothetical protein
VTTEMPPWYRPSASARTAGVPPSNRRSVARARPVRRGHDGVRPGQTTRCLGERARGKGAPRPACGLGRGAARTPRAAGTRAQPARRRGAKRLAPFYFAGHQFEFELLHKFE